MAMMMGDGERDPFLIFPEEVWEKILDRMEDSSDISNLLQAFPALRLAFETKLPLWLFNQAVPDIIRYLDTNEILASREVCRRWSQGVDQCLENAQGYPSCKVYDPKKDQLMGILEASPQPHHYWKYFGGNYFIVEEMFTEFLAKLDGTPPGRSPFIGRQIEIYPHKHEDIGDFWAEALNMLQKFGEHIWFLNLCTWHNQCQYGFCSAFLDMLCSLPNLKSLYLGGGVTLWRSEHLDELLESRRDSLPPLPQLETLEIEFESLAPKMVEILLLRYSPQVRRLQLQLCLWKNDYADLFANLIELTVNNISSNKDLLELLMGINTPQLSSLRLASDRLSGFVIELSIFTCLRRFPNLRNLNLNCVYVHDEGDMYKAVVLRLDNACPIPSLKSLVLYEDPELNYDFLLCFPSLEYLKIHLRTVATPISIAHSMMMMSWRSIATLLNVRECLRRKKMYESNLWGFLPKLKGITIAQFVVGEEDARDTHFSRTYFSRDEYVAGALLGDNAANA